MPSAIETLQKQFADSTRYRSLAPLWYWSDDMNESEMARQIAMLQEQDIHEFMIFPIAGMTVPYLSEAYFEKFEFCVREFKKRRMKLWIYDDYNWPSGLAGGKVADLYPEYLMKVCRFYRYEVGGEHSRKLEQRLPVGNVVSATARRLSDGKLIDLRDRLGGTALHWTAPGAGAWEVTVGIVQPLGTKLDTVTMARWASNATGYLDVMNHEAVAKYIDLVYDAHNQRVPGDYGKTIQGYFTDEPGMWYDFTLPAGRDTLYGSAEGHGAGKGMYPYSSRLDRTSILYGLHTVVPWTHDLLHLFEERFGYDMRPHLEKLTRSDEASRKVAYDFFSLISDRFAEAYCEQIADWCGKRHVAYSGHYGEGVHTGDYYKQIRPQQVPGIDLLGNMSCVYRRLSWPKRVASVARQFGRDRVLCEEFACSPWTNQMADRVQECDLLSILGINLHASIDFVYSYRGFRKYAANPPGFYQSPQWKYQGEYSRHVTRLATMVSTGKPDVDTAVYYPTQAAVSNTLVDDTSNQAIDRNVIDTLYCLIRSQIDADIVFETSLDSDLPIRAGKVVGKTVAYGRIVVPDVSIMAPRTLERLAKFVRGGGTLVWMHQVPMMAPHGESLKKQWKDCFGFAPSIGKITRDEHRKLGKGKMIYLTNPSDALTSSAALHTGTLAELFDGTESMICTQPHYPLWFGVDLGEARPVKSVAMHIEAIKADIDFAYRLEVSSDGTTWKTAAEQTLHGEVHELTFEPVMARHLRLHVDSETHRLYSAHHLKVGLEAADGATEYWAPAAASMTRMAEEMPEALPDLRFFTPEGGLATCLGMNYRRGSGYKVYNIVNMTTSDKKMAGRFESEAGRSPRVARWNLDTGQLEAVAQDDDASFEIMLEPGEAASLVVTKSQVVEGESLDLAPDYQVVRTLTGPWPAKAQRQNAFPLAAGKVQMRDADFGGAWLDAPEGRVPDELSLVPSIAFRATFSCGHVTGNEQLLLEKAIYDDIRVNGQALLGDPIENRYFDCHNYAMKLGARLKKGRNVIEGVCRPEIYERKADGEMYRETNVQPAMDLMILGDFCVKKGRIVAPVTTMRGNRRWEDQGFSFYSGSMDYRVELGKLEPGARYGLNIVARRGVVEVMVNGRSVQQLVAPPFRVDLSRFLRRGGPADITLRVTNSLASVFSGFHMGECFNQPIVNLASGLEKVELLKLSDPDVLTGERL